ncbi:DUF4913 domain-containing protein [Salinispora cortesiana]|uniref:DUF4913 domain-containing protein n=1 Tax=Salinispora cortesiana TaxID=1305843 RepID=UPI00040975ED|nr:DUF4913 domain-containing protein [Salinispora cortesiana]
MTSTDPDDLYDLDDVPASGPSRWAWRHADPGTAAALWLDLIDWVNWIVPRYELTGEAATIPPCWYRHPVAVEELTALMSAWQAAYHGKPQAPRDDLITWHDRWFWPSIDRLQTRAGWRSCIDGNSHQERKLRRWTPDPHMTSFVAQGPGPPHDPTV